MNEFIEKLKETFGDRLISVGRHNIGVTSFLNKNGVFVVLDKVSADDLFKIKSIYTKYKKQFSTPLVVDKEFFRRSADVFCMEMLELKENGEVVYGENLISNIEVEDEDLRRQIEYELRSKLLILKGAFIDLPLDRKVVDDIAYRSMYNFLLILRNLLRLRGKLINDATLIEEFEKEFNIKLDAFKALRDTPKIPFDKLLKIFKKYIEEVDGLVKIADKVLD
ncbi:hypothetical protein [Hippea maritima]|uniref:Uncharacterized protein n=1 Tax=Hippea maritima (strain ATCC 700847 / DSM 10411 / MH2) TaxID=760142 RepID=F2LVE9_HIPMA|nr:hypothetical protein [Hippea maritima]AEA33733.1 hypothetical protein Hipma_0763 [Hippea maritima DSM 10411]